MKKVLCCLTIFVLSIVVMTGCSNISSKVEVKDSTGAGKVSFSTKIAKECFNSDNALFCVDATELAKIIQEQSPSDKLTVTADTTGSDEDILNFTISFNSIEEYNTIMEELSMDAIEKTSFAESDEFNNYLLSLVESLGIFSEEDMTCEDCGKNIFECECGYDEDEENTSDDEEYTNDDLEGLSDEELEEYFSDESGEDDNYTDYDLFVANIKADGTNPEDKVTLSVPTLYGVNVYAWYAVSLCSKYDKVFNVEFFKSVFKDLEDIESWEDVEEADIPEDVDIESANIDESAVAEAGSEILGVDESIIDTDLSEDLFSEDDLSEVFPMEFELVFGSSTTGVINLWDYEEDMISVSSTVSEVGAVGDEKVIEISNNNIPNADVPDNDEPDETPKTFDSAYIIVAGLIFVIAGIGVIVFRKKSIA